MFGAYRVTKNHQGLYFINGRPAAVARPLKNHLVVLIDPLDPRREHTVLDNGSCLCWQGTCVDNCAKVDHTRRGWDIERGYEADCRAACEL